MEAVVVAVMNSLCVGLRNRLILEETLAAGVPLGEHVQRMVGSLVAQYAVGPHARRHGGMAHQFRTGNMHMGMAFVVEAQGEHVGAYAQLQDGAHRFAIEPKVGAEVATEENGVLRVCTPSTTAQVGRHLMADGLLVQLRRDDDVLVAHVAGHDVLIELHGQLVAKAQDAVRRRGRKEGAGLRHVLDDSDDIAVNMDKVGAVGRSSKAAELVVTLGVGEVARHVDGQAQVARGGQHVVGCVERVGLVSDPGVQVGPLRVTSEAILHAHVLQVLELAVEVGQFQL